MKFRFLFGAAMVVALLGATGTASAVPPPIAYTCTGGSWTGDPSTSTFTSIPSGNYASITVTGVCNVVPDAVINVVGNINVAPGGVLDAQSAPSTITVGHDVTATWGAILGLGCLPNPPGHFTGHPCAVDPDASSDITVKGNLTATHANTVLLDGITVNQNVTLVSGGSNLIPWPIKDNAIGGNLVVREVRPTWIGVLFNEIGGSAILTHITITDPGDPDPTISVVGNMVEQNLVCLVLRPNLFIGFPGEFNVVGGLAIGQCAMRA
jgi:hypothetical protein